MECSNCGANNDDDANYCDQCGAALNNERDGDGDSVEDVLATVNMNAAKPDVELRFEAPSRNLIRGDLGRAEFRDADAESPQGALGVLHGNFSTFNDWYEINSMWEGNFLERVLPGAFADTITNDVRNMRVLYDHGMDPSLGNKPLGPIRTLEERKDGAYYEVDLLDTDYNRDFIVPALQGRTINGQMAGSQLGASFAFAVQEDTWRSQPKPSAYNPKGIPERDIVRTQVFEFGPVTFPANPSATAGMRSMSDAFMARLIGDQGARERFESRVGKKVADRLVAAVPEELREEMARIAVDGERSRRQAALRRRTRILVLTSA